MDFARGRLGCAHLFLKGAKKLVFLWKTLEDVVEDVGSARIFAWKTQNQSFKLKKNYIHLLDLRLPGKCAGGVHVFQGVFQRLPTTPEIEILTFS